MVQLEFETLLKDTEERRLNFLQNFFEKYGRSEDDSEEEEVIDFSIPEVKKRKKRKKCSLRSSPQAIEFGDLNSYAISNISEQCIKKIKAYIRSENEFNEDSDLSYEDLSEDDDKSICNESQNETLPLNFKFDLFYSPSVLYSPKNAKEDSLTCDQGPVNSIEGKDLVYKISTLPSWVLHSNKSPKIDALRKDLSICSLTDDSITIQKNYKNSKRKYFDSSTPKSTVKNSIDSLKVKQSCAASDTAVLKKSDASTAKNISLSEKSAAKNLSRDDMTPCDKISETLSTVKSNDKNYCTVTTQENYLKHSRRKYVDFSGKKSTNKNSKALKLKEFCTASDTAVLKKSDVLPKKNNSLSEKSGAENLCDDYLLSGDKLSENLRAIELNDENCTINTQENGLKDSGKKLVDPSTPNSTDKNSKLKKSSTASNTAILKKSCFLPKNVSFLEKPAAKNLSDEFNMSGDEIFGKLSTVKSNDKNYCTITTPENYQKDSGTKYFDFSTPKSTNNYSRASLKLKKCSIASDTAVLQKRNFSRKKDVSLSEKYNAKNNSDDYMKSHNKRSKNPSGRKHVDPAILNLTDNNSKLKKCSAASDTAILNKSYISPKKKVSFLEKSAGKNLSDGYSMSGYEISGKLSTFKSNDNNYCTITTPENCQKDSRTKHVNPSTPNSIDKNTRASLKIKKCSIASDAALLKKSDISQKKNGSSSEKYAAKNLSNDYMMSCYGRSGNLSIVELNGENFCTITTPENYLKLSRRKHADSLTPNSTDKNSRASLELTKCSTASDAVVLKKSDISRKKNVFLSEKSAAKNVSDDYLSCNGISENLSTVELIDLDYCTITTPENYLKDSKRIPFGLSTPMSTDKDLRTSLKLKKCSAASNTAILKKSDVSPKTNVSLLKKSAANNLSHDYMLSCDEISEELSTVQSNNKNYCTKVNSPLAFPYYLRSRKYSSSDRCVTVKTCSVGDHSVLRSKKSIGRSKDKCKISSKNESCINKYSPKSNMLTPKILKKKSCRKIFTCMSSKDKFSNRKDNFDISSKNEHDINKYLSNFQFGRPRKTPDASPAMNTDTLMSYSEEELNNEDNPLTELADLSCSEEQNSTFDDAIRILKAKIPKKVAGMKPLSKTSKLTPKLPFDCLSPV